MSEVVVKSRVRLARNLKEYPFPSRMNADQAKAVIEKVYDALKGAKQNFRKIMMEEIDAVERFALADRHLISREFAQHPKNRALILLQDESVSIMLNEEDHIRIQAFENGFELESAYEKADEIDSLISSKLAYAFSERLGYLTECPTNLGTALRASVMLHLPALNMSHSMSTVASNLSKLGLTIRGFYGEGSKAGGSFFQLSNQVSLGISEKSAVENLKNITSQLIAREIKTRDRIIMDITAQDRIFRSLGILKTARVMDHAEALGLLSDIRLGAASKLFDTLSVDHIDELIEEIQPSSILFRYGEDLSPAERDIKRAEMLREKLN